MANRYWVGGTANWDATAGTKWALTSGGAGGQAVPTAADDVFFSAASTGTCTIPASTTVNCRSIDCTGFTNTLRMAATTSTINVGNATGGAVKFVAGMTFTLTARGTINLIATTASTTYTFTCAGIGMPNIVVNTGSTTKIQLADNLTASGSTLTLTAGILDTNGKSVTVAQFLSDNSNTRTLTMGASTFTLGAAGGLAGWVSSSTTGLTVTANSANIGLVGHLTTGALNFNGASLNFSGSGNQSILGGGAITVNNFVRNGTASKTDSFTLSANVTSTGLVAFQGNSVTNRLLITSDSIGTTRTITSAGLFVMNNIDFQDITGAGAANWSALSSLSVGDCGGNSGIGFPSSTTQTATGTSGFTWSTHGWTSRVPLPQDDVVINNSFSASQTITADMPRLGRSINFTGATGSPTVNFSVAASIYGSLVLASGVAPSGTSTLTFSGRSSYSITSASQTFTQATVINAPSGTYTLTDNYTNSLDSSFFGLGVQLSMTTGTLTTNNNVTLTGAQSGVTINGGTLNMGSGTWTIGNTATLAFWYAANATVNGSNASIVLNNASANTRQFTGGDQTYGTLTYNVAGSTGQLTIAGSNTFDTINFSDSSNARTLALTSGTTTTILNRFNVNGTSGKLMSIISTVAASTATLTKSSGIVACDYLSVKDSTATGGAKWYAGANSTNVSGNTGWIFTAADLGDFFQLF